MPADIHIRIDSEFNDSGISKAIASLNKLVGQATKGSGSNTSAATKQTQQLTAAVKQLTQAQTQNAKQTQNAQSAAQQQSQQIDQLISKTTRLQRLTGEMNRATDQRMDAEKKLADITAQSVKARQRLADIQNELDGIEAKGNTNLTEKTQLLRRLAQEEENLNSLEKQRADAQRDIDRSAEAYRRGAAAAKDYGTFLRQNNVETKESVKALQAAEDNIRTIRDLNQRTNPLSTFSQQGELNRTRTSLNSFVSDLTSVKDRAARVFGDISKGTTDFALTIDRSVATIRKSFTGLNTASTSGLGRMEDQLARLVERRNRDVTALVEANDRLEAAERRIAEMRTRVQGGESIPATEFREVQREIDSASRSADRATASLEKTDAEIAKLQTHATEMRQKMQSLMTEATQAATHLTGETKAEKQAQEMFTNLNRAYTQGIAGLNTIEAKLKAEAVQINDAMDDLGGKGLGAGPSEALKQVKSAMQGTEETSRALADLWRSLQNAATALARSVSGALVGALDRMGGALDRSLSSAGSKFAALRKDLDATGRSMGTFDKSMQRTAAGWSLLMAGGQMTQTGMSLFRRLDESMGGYLDLEKASTRAAIAGGVSPDDIMDFVFKIERGQLGQAPVKNISSSEIAQGAYYYSSAIGTQITPQNQAGIAQALVPMLQLSGYSGTAPEEIIKGVLNAGMEFGIQPTNTKAMSDISNLYGYLANQTTMEPQDITEFFKMVGANANVLAPEGGMPAIHQAMALAYIDSMYGQRGGRTGRGVDQLLSSLLSPSGPTQKAAKDIWGVDDVRDIFFSNQYDPQTGQTKYSLKNGMASLFEPFLNMSDEQWKKAQATMFSQGASRAVVPLIAEMRKPGNEGKWQDVLKDINSPEALTTIMEAGAKASQTLTASLQDLKNAWGQFVATVTGSVKGSLISGISMLANGLRELADIVKVMPTLGQGLALFGTGLAGVLTLGGSLLSFAGAILILERAAQMTGAGLGTFLSVLAMIPKLSLLAIPVVGLLAAAGIALYEAWTHNLGGIQDKWNAFKKTFTTGDFSTKFFDFLGSDKVHTAFTWFMRLGSAFKELVAGIGMGFGPLNNLGSLLQDVFGRKLGADILQHLMTAGAAMRSFIGGLGQMGSGLFAMLPSLDHVHQAFQAIMELLVYGDTNKGLLGGLNALGQSFGIDDLAQKIVRARGLVLQFVGTMRDQFGKIGDNLGQIFTVNNLIAALRFALGFVKGFAIGVASAFAGAVRSVELLTRALTHVGDAGRAINDLIQRFFGFKVSIDQLGMAIGVAFGARWMASVLAINPVMNALKLVVSYGGQAAAMLLNLGAQAAIAAAKFAILNAEMIMLQLIAFSAPLAAVLLLVAALTTLIAVFAGLGSAASFLQGVWHGMVDAFSLAVNVFAILFNIIYTVGSAIATLLGWLSSLTGGLISASNAGYVLGAALVTLAIAGAISAVISGLAFAVEKAQLVWTAAVAAVTAFVAALRNLSIASMVAGFMSALDSALMGLQTAATTARAAIVLLVDAVKGLTLAEIGAALTNPLTIAVAAIAVIVLTAITSLGMLINMTGSVKNSFLAMGAAIVGVFQAINNAIVHSIHDSVDGLLNGFLKNIPDMGIGAIKDLKSGLAVVLGATGSMWEQSHSADWVNDYWDQFGKYWDSNASRTSELVRQSGKGFGEILKQGFLTGIKTLGGGGADLLDSLGLGGDFDLSKVNPSTLIQKLLGIDPSKLGNQNLGTLLSGGLKSMGYSDYDQMYQQQMDMLRRAQADKLASKTYPFGTQDRRGQTKGVQDKWLATEIMDTSNMPLKGAPDVGSIFTGISDDANDAADSTDEAAQKVQDFIKQASDFGGLAGFTTQLKLIGVGGYAITAADGLNRANQAMTDGYRVVVENTNAIAQQSQGLKDWSDDLINAPGYWGKIDDIMAKHLITMGDYTQAQEAQVKITEQNARIQDDVLAIQAKQAPVLADLQGKQMAYLDQVRNMKGVQQMAALAAMDQNEQIKAQQALMMAAAAASGQYGAAGEKMVTQLIQGAVAADPYLAALLKKMGLIDIGADGTVTVHFDSAKNANTAMEELTKSIDALTKALGGVPPLHINDDGSVQQATDHVKQLRESIRGYNDALYQGGTHATGGVVRPYGPNPGGDLPPGTAPYKDPRDKNLPTPTTPTAPGVPPAASYASAAKTNADTYNTTVTAEINKGSSQVQTAANTSLSNVKIDTKGLNGQIPALVTSFTTALAQQLGSGLGPAIAQAFTSGMGGGQVGLGATGHGGTSPLTGMMQQYAKQAADDFKTSFQKEFSLALIDVFSGGTLSGGKPINPSGMMAKEPDTNMFTTMAQNWATSAADQFKKAFQPAFATALSEALSANTLENTAHPDKPVSALSVFNEIGENWATQAADSFKKAFQPKFATALSEALTAPSLQDNSTGKGIGATQAFGPIGERWASDAATAFKNAFTPKFQAALSEALSSAMGGGPILDNPLLSGQLGNGGAATETGTFTAYGEQIATQIATSVASGLQSQLPQALAAANIGGIISQALSGIGGATGAAMGGVGGGIGGAAAALAGGGPTITITVTADISQFAAAAQSVVARAGALGALNPIPKVGIDFSVFSTGAQTVVAACGALGALNPIPRVFIDITVFLGGAQNVKNELADIGGTTVTPTVGINDNASGVIASISAQLDNLNGKVAVVSVQTVNTVTTISNPVQAHALGGRITSGLTWMNEFGAEAISRTLPGVGTLVALPEGSYVHSSTETRGMQHEATLHEQINAAANRRQMFAPTSVQGGDINITFTGPVTMRDERDIKTLAALLGEEINKQQGRQLRAERRVRSTDMGRFNT